MNIKHILLVAVFFVNPFQIYSQIHTFEQGKSGVVLPMLNLSGTPDIQFWQVGAAYVVEGKLALSGYYGTPLVDDTLFQKDSLLKEIPLNGQKSFMWHGNATMELIEPDKVFPLSVALQLGYKLLSFSHTKNVSFQGKNLEILGRSHKTHHFYAGLMFGYRFFTGTHSSLVPTLNYNFGYLMKRRKNATSVSESDDDFGHEANFGLLYSQMFTSYIGMMVEPNIGLGYNHNEEELLIVAKLKAGLVLQFN